LVIFFPGGERLFLQGVFENSGVLLWCFCGENVVECVQNVVR
jgi:hypothetical protein